VACGGWWRVWLSWPGEVASPLARRGEFARCWRVLMIVAAGVGGLSVGGLLAVGEEFRVGGSVVRRRELFLPEAAVSWWVAEYVVVVGVGGGLSGFRGVVGGCCGGRWWVWLVWLVLVGSAVARVWGTWEW